MADSPLFNLQLQISGSSDDGETSPISTSPDSNETLPDVRENSCDALVLQCITGQFKLKNSSTFNLNIAPKHKPHQVVIQIGDTNVWYSDTPPNSEVDMPQTVEMDFVVQILGETEMNFGTEERCRVRPGDLTIQNSTVYMWRNPSRIQWSRMIGFVSPSH
jgi:hypothetical protein